MVEQPLKSRFYFAISSDFYSFVPIFAIIFVYSHSQSGNRQRKNLNVELNSNDYEGNK